MRKQNKAVLIILVSALVIGAPLGLWLHDSTPVTHEEALLSTPIEDLEAFNDEPLKPLPEPEKFDPIVVALGKKLFHEKRLSGDNTISCSTCHNLALGGIDHLSHSFGIHGAEGSINAPTVLNSAFNFIQFWDGRSATLEDQAKGPIQNPKEMGSRFEDVIEKLKQDEEYIKDFQRAFNAPPTIEGLTSAIATFERTLVTNDSPFDHYLKGDTSALSADAKEGYIIFKKYGCASCHQGRNVGGNMFQKFGIMGDYFVDRGNITEADAGRFNVTHDEADRHVFKVPSLRNVELTAPYFHDGTAKTLEAAVNIMAKYQLGRSLNDNEVHQLIAFLRSLTGKQTP